MGTLTLDDLADTNLGDKVAPADGGVEPAIRLRVGDCFGQLARLGEKHWVNCLLVALIVGLGGVLEVAGVLNGDLLANGGLGTGALNVRGLGDAHLG